VTGDFGPGVLLGRRIGPFDHSLDADLLRRYATATRDPSPQAQAGAVASPTAIVTAIWDAQNAAREALVAESIQRSAAGGVHGEHDILLHRPITPG
jgi:hypothetical protein